MNQTNTLSWLISIGLVLVLAALLVVEAGRRQPPQRRAGLADHGALDALLHGILENDASQCHRALVAGADPNGRDKFGQTPLIHVARSRHRCAAAVARLLIDRGADVSAVTPVSLTPLLNAIGCDNYDVAELLLEHGADPGATADLPTALDYAIRLEAGERMVQLVRNAVVGPDVVTMFSVDAAMSARRAK
jgi:ankyrin repeat protein